MRIRRLLSLVMLPLAFAACDESTAPEPPSEIRGVWQMQLEHPSMANAADQMAFGPGDRYVRDFKLYRDASHAVMTSAYRQEGTFRLRGDRLELRIARETRWEEGKYEPPLVTPVSPRWADAGTVEISGNRMVRTFFTYPADAPILTTATYFRPGLD